MDKKQALIAVSRDGATGVLELARPALFNCLSMDTFAEIGEALRGFEADPAVRALLICAQGKHFCTGAELGEVKEKRATAAEIDAFLRSGHDVLRALEASRLPVVCAVQGLCLAGGMELLLACDVAFAARSARFGDQHAQFGLVPGWGGSQRLPRAIGMRRAMDLFVSARWIEAETAEAWGLVNHVVADEALRAEALAYCARLAERSAPGLALMKRLALAGRDLALPEALEFEIASVAGPLRSAQVSEGIAAFEQKRKPDFG